MKHVKLPIDIFATRDLTVGEQVAISGSVFTVHGDALRYLYEGNALDVNTSGSLLYHCAPIGKKRGKKWDLVSASPTATAPEENQLGDVLGRCEFRGVIGRGALGPRSLAACKRFNACYFHTVGGAGLSLANFVTEVREVHLTDQFSGADAVWELAFENFPAVVTIDAWGRSLHDIVRDVSQRRFVAIQD